MLGITDYLDRNFDKYKTAERKVKEKQAFIEQQKEIEKNRPESPSKLVKKITFREEDEK